MKTLDTTELGRDGFALIRRYQLYASRMPIRSIPNFRVSLETKAMDAFCSIMRLISRITTVSQPDQRFRGRMVTIGFFALWKRWKQKWRLSSNSTEYQSGHLSVHASCENIGAHSSLGMGRTR